MVLITQPAGGSSRICSVSISSAVNASSRPLRYARRSSWRGRPNPCSSHKIFAHRTIGEREASADLTTPNRISRPECRAVNDIRPETAGTVRARSESSRRRRGGSALVLAFVPEIIGRARHVQVRASRVHRIARRRRNGSPSRGIHPTHCGFWRVPWKPATIGWRICTRISLRHSASYVAYGSPFRLVNRTPPPATLCAARSTSG